MKTSKEKKNNKALIITLSLCVSVVVVIILLLTLIDPIVGTQRMKKAKEAAKNSSEIVISSPLYQDAFLQGAEVVLTGEEKEELADLFLAVSEKASYDKSFDSLGGFWHTKIEFHTSNERYAVYLKDDEIYVANGAKGYEFEIDDDREDLYEKFINRINQMLEEATK